MPGQLPFFDELTTFMTDDLDLRRLDHRHAAFSTPSSVEVAEAAEILGVDAEFRAKVLEARAKLAPMRIGRRGNLQEWLEDWDETEKSHRHISGLWGLFPGHEISSRRRRGWPRRPGRPGAARTSWQRLVVAWKAACWARLGDEGQSPGEPPLRHEQLHDREPVLDLLATPFRWTARFGFSAAIVEMLLQSHEWRDRIPAGPARDRGRNG